MSNGAQPLPKLLIVEDNELDALLLQEALKKAVSGQLRIKVAVTVRDAIEYLKADRFDIILSDLSLPDGEGLDTFTRLKSVAEDTPIILLTGLENEALGLEAVRAGAKEYIVKGTMNEKALWRVISYAIERHNLERAVLESEKRYRRLLGSVTDYIYTVKIEEGRSVSTQHGPGCAKVTGYTPREFADESHLWHRMVHPDDRGAVLKQIELLLRGESTSLEHRLIHKDQSIRWVRHTPVLRRDDHGHLTGYDGLISDITERKMAEEALRQAVEDLQKSRDALKSAHLQLIEAEKLETVGRMAAGVAHEVQNPLQILLMSLDYISQKTGDSHDAVLDGVVAEMRVAAKRADAIIRGLLAFTQSDELKIVAENLNLIMEKALALVQPSLANSKIDVKINFDPELVPVPVDRAQIEQVLVILLTNAIDAMRAGGQLTIRTGVEKLSGTRHDAGAREAGQFYDGDLAVVAEIADTGSGISPEALRKIFDPFFTTKATGKGTGLGLTIAKRIIDLHGGLLEIENREHGGARARILFKAPKSATEVKVLAESSKRDLP